MQVCVNHKIGIQRDNQIFYLFFKNLFLIMGESIIQFILANVKWKNIEYDFSDHSNNCTLNVNIRYLVINNYFMLILLNLLISG